MAGILFTDGKLVLAGYKPYKGYITGIGGKVKEHEQLFHCAVRETLEELFGWTTIHPEIITVSMERLECIRETHYKGYTQFHCSFESLRLLLVFLSMFMQVKSPYYTAFPFTIDELLFNRIAPEGAEIAQLALLPYVSELRIANHFANDLTHALTPASRT